MFDESRGPRPGRDLIAALVCVSAAIAGVIASGARDFPTLHTILDTGALVLSGVLALMMWDLGWRTGQRLARLKAVCFAVVAVLELLHVLTALQFTAEDPGVRRFAMLLRPGTWPPAAYLLPLGLWAALLLRDRLRLRQQRSRKGQRCGDTRIRSLVMLGDQAECKPGALRLLYLFNQLSYQH